MKLFANYILERLGQDIILIPEIGFATFQIADDECYLVDIYVEKVHRKEGFATVMADQIAEIAKRKGCKTLKGTVQTNTNGAETNEKILLAYGMTFHSEIKEKNLKIFKKDL